MRPVTVAPSRMASGGLMMPTLTWNVRVAESAWGATSRTRPVAFTCGSLVRAISTSGVARAGPNELLGHVEDGVAPALTRELHDHLPGADHFARFGADRGDRARSIGEQGRVAQLILRDAQLRLGGVDLGLGGEELLLGLVEFGAGRPAVLQELLLPPEGEARLGQHRLSRGEVGLRRAQRILLVLGVEPGDELARLEHVADIDGPLDHASVEAKGEADLVLGANLAGQRDDLAFRARSTVTVRTGRASRPVGLACRSLRRVAAIRAAATILRLEHWRCLRGTSSRALDVSPRPELARRLGRDSIALRLHLHAVQYNYMH